jgi:hypothetical protein
MKNGIFNLKTIAEKTKVITPHNSVIKLTKEIVTTTVIRKYTDKYPYCYDLIKETRETIKDTQ